MSALGHTSESRRLVEDGLNRVRPFSEFSDPVQAAVIAWFGAKRRIPGYGGGLPPTEADKARVAACMAPALEAGLSVALNTLKGANP